MLAIGDPEQTAKGGRPASRRDTMLELNPDIVCFLIDKSHEFHAKEQAVIPEEPNSPGEDWARQVLADQTGDMTYHELRATVNDLEPDQQVVLVALMWLGRGDFELAEWEDALAEARRGWNGRTAQYLIATPLVADYLSEGLSLHGQGCA